MTSKSEGAGSWPPSGSDIQCSLCGYPPEAHALFKHGECPVAVWTPTIDPHEFYGKDEIDPRLDKP